MGTNDEKLFTQEQYDQVKKAIQEIVNSEYKDPSNPPPPEEIFDSYRKGVEEYYKPDALDYSNPETLCKMHWKHYLGYLIIHGQPSNKKGSRHFNTEKDRKKESVKLKKLLGHAPTSRDFKLAFPIITKLDDEIYQIIDEDLK